MALRQSQQQGASPWEPVQWRPLSLQSVSLRSGVCPAPSPHAEAASGVFVQQAAEEQSWRLLSLSGVQNRSLHVCLLLKVSEMQKYKAGTPRE